MAPVGKLYSVPAQRQGKVVRTIASTRSMSPLTRHRSGASPLSVALSSKSWLITSISRTTKSQTFSQSSHMGRSPLSRVRTVSTSPRVLLLPTTVRLSFPLTTDRSMRSGKTKAIYSSVIPVLTCNVDTSRFLTPFPSPLSSILIAS